MGGVSLKDNTYNMSEDIKIYDAKGPDKIFEHTHDFLEIAYIKSGKIWHYINGQKQLLEQGDYVFIDYGIGHSFQKYNGEQSVIINFLFKPLLIDKSLKNCKSLNQVLSNYMITSDFLINISNLIYVFHDHNEVLPIINKILSELENKSTGYFQIIRAYLVEIMIITLRKYKEINRDMIFTSNNGSVAFLIQYANENYDKQISLTQLANRLNVSLSHLSKLFKEATGQNYSEYVQHVRIQQACRLLSNSDKKINVIAGEVGYSDYKYFNEVFRKKMNCSPKYYRKSLK